MRSHTQSLPVLLPFTLISDQRNSRRSRSADSGLINYSSTRVLLAEQKNANNSTRNNLQCSIPSSHRSPQTESESNSRLTTAGRTSRLRRSTKGWPWPMSFSRISLESQKCLASCSRSYIESTVSGWSRFNTTSSLDAGPADGSNWRRTPRELYSDQPSDRHSSKENSVTRSSGDRCSAGGSGC